ncbi:MAG TPA: hypothetical protein VN634_06690 [Candidatus Limnocylindrales bacterium]|nr:hypothetical protein [Candidatus Limnocylindrales bacterium]
MRTSEHDARWPRTSFRLLSVNSYPMANAIISVVHRPTMPYSDSVKWSLLLVTLLAIVFVALTASATPFGFWPALLTVNLIAWQVIPTGPVLGKVAVNMMPFLSYVPRGAGSLLVIPIVLCFAARRWWLCAACVLCVFLWHLGLGLILAIVVPLGLALASLPARRITDFHDRALVASLVVLALALAVSRLTSIPAVDASIQSLTNLHEDQHVRMRLLGSEYSLCVLVVVVAARRLVGWLGAQVPLLARLGSETGSRIAIASLLVAIGLWHAPSFAAVAREQSGFFNPTCGRAVSVPLPSNWKQLRLSNEASLFRSFGDYLLALRYVDDRARTRSARGPGRVTAGVTPAAARATAPDRAGP